MFHSSFSLLPRSTKPARTRLAAESPGKRGAQPHGLFDKNAEGGCGFAASIPCVRYSLERFLRGGERLLRIALSLALVAVTVLLAACAGDAGIEDSVGREMGEQAPETSAEAVNPDAGVSGAICIAGAPQQDCDGDASNGCETDTFTDVNHCGACNSPCASSCVEGRCADPIDLALNFGRTCALLGTGEATCWGLNYYGQLGNGSGGTVDGGPLPTEGTALEPPDNEAAEVGLEPTFVQRTLGTPLRNIRQLALGLHHTCALVGREGAVYCWGANYFGQLGDGTLSPRPYAGPVLAREGTAPLTGITYLSAGRMQTCGVTTEERVVCWGRERFGSLGRATGTDGTERAVQRPSYVLSQDRTPLDGVRATALGATFSCFSLETGLACTGQAFNGRLGNGTGGPNVDLAGPVLGPSGHGVWTQPVLAVTNAFVSQCVLTSGGRVACWGNGGEGQLGQGDLAIRRSPAYVLDSQGENVLQGIRDLSAASSHVCATTQEDQAWCWGWNEYHTLGNTLDASELADAGERSTLPVAVLDPSSGEPLSDIDRVIAGREHTCALMRDRRVLCWGRNRYGELGQGMRSEAPALAAEVRVHPN